MDNNSSNEIGVVGLGFMGCSIVTAFLIRGYRVIAVAGLDADLEHAPGRIQQDLRDSFKQGIHSYDPEVLNSKVRYTRDYADLRDCFLISENVIENAEIKIKVLASIEAVVAGTTIITTNTSAIPIAILQSALNHPGRFLGMHWAEPAYTSRFLEIICGPETDETLAQSLYSMATGWGKEPTLLRKDIRGFITNRLMYALYREALYLVENGYSSMEDIDRACKNDAGRWMTFCGPFRYMDLTGLQAYYHVMKDLFPTLTNMTSVPGMVENIAASGGNGISNGHGFYHYTPEESAAWEKAFKEFAYDIYALSLKYPVDLVERRLTSGGD